MYVDLHAVSSEWVSYCCKLKQQIEQTVTASISYQTAQTSIETWIASLNRLSVFCGERTLPWSHGCSPVKKGFTFTRNFFFHVKWKKRTTSVEAAWLDFKENGLKSSMEIMCSSYGYSTHFHGTSSMLTLYKTWTWLSQTAFLWTITSINGIQRLSSIELKL